MAVLILALIVDLLIGDPKSLWQRLPHPVALFGKVIDFFDRNRSALKFDRLGEKDGNEPGFIAGLILLGVLLLISGAAGEILNFISKQSWQLGMALEVVVVAVLIAQKSLYEHGRRVIDALRNGGVIEGRKAVSFMVGRDVSQLDESGISKAAIESVAENFSDGVVAPALWYAAFGLPGILFYKAVNTADSMIGHRTVKYENFGKGAAVLDDWMNWPAARLSSLIIVLAVAVGRGGKLAKTVWQITFRDAPLHLSPNAGWPEASFASALGLSLGGPLRYGERILEAAILNGEGREIANVADIERSLRLFLRCCFCLLALCVSVWFLLR